MSEDAPITLKEAAEVFFRGHITASSLRAERNRGHLITFKKGSKECTTINELKKMCAIKTKLSAKALRLPRSGVYVIGYGDKVKIGITVDFKKRISTLQGAIPETLVEYGFINGATTKDERALHRRFSELRITGEWFRKEEPLESWIKNGCML